MEIVNRSVHPQQDLQNSTYQWQSFILMSFIFLYFYSKQNVGGAPSM
jgi:hypothetical protein